MRRNLFAGAVALLVVWAPVPFGSVPPWAHSVLEVAAFLLLGAAAWTWRNPREARAVAIPAAAIVGISGLGVLQSLRWPAVVVETISPAHAALSGTNFGALSLAPEVSRSIAWTWLAMAALLPVAAVAGAEVRSRRIVAAGVIAAAVGQALYGARQWLARADEIWGVTVVASDRLRGSFVNPNHLALLLEIALPVALAWTWVAWREGRAAPLERRLPLAGLPALAWLVLFVALAFTGSRAGLLGGACGALATALALAARRRRLELGSLGLVAPLVGLIAVVAIGAQAGFGRWLATSAYELSWSSRLEVYRATVELWQRFPLTGTGLASFREAFPLVQPAGLAGTWWHAHNDLLELLATTGLVGALLVAAGAAGLLVAMVDRLREAGSSEEAAAVAAALGALVAVAVHSWFDFGLTMPANAAALVIVCGAALGRSGRA